MPSLTAGASKPPSKGPCRAIDLLGYIFRSSSVAHDIARGSTSRHSARLQAGVLEWGMLSASSKCWVFFC